MKGGTGKRRIQEAESENRNRERRIQVAESERRNIKMEDTRNRE